MKQLFVAALVVLSSLATVAQTSHFKTSQSGAAASLSVTPDQFTSITLQISRGSINNVTNTNILFVDEVFSADFSSLTFTQVFGIIPDSDFTGDNVNGLQLNLDTSTIDPTQTFSETCTLDLNTFILTCGPPTTGTIQLTFTGNGAQVTQVITSEAVQTMGPDTIRTHTSSTNSSANAQGSVLGVAVSTSGATISLNKNSVLEVTRF